MLLRDLVVFVFVKEKKDYRDSKFGYECFSFFPRRRLNKEIEILEGLLPELFDLFDKGIPETWFKFESASGRITKHVQLVLRGIDYVYGGRNETEYKK
jgi:hypothetical protein